MTASFILPFTVNVREEDLWTLEDVGRFLDLVAGKHKEASMYYTVDANHYILLYF